MVSRADRSALAEWWWTVDKYILGGALALMLVGIVLSFAGSPAVAERLGYDSFHFTERHIAFAVPALAVMIATSFLSPQNARRVFLASIAYLPLLLVLMIADARPKRPPVPPAERWQLSALTLTDSAYRQPPGSSGLPP